MSLNPVKKKLLNFLGSLLIKPGVTLLCKSLRINIINNNVPDELYKNHKNFIVAFWHGTMIVPWFIQNKKNMAALVSQSKDGDLLTKLLTNWNYKVVRGSSSSGGEAALESLMELTMQNYSVAITPDGPRGPKKKFKAGAVVLAKKTNLPLVLLGAGYRRKIILKSWDRFKIPYFFSEVNIICSDPVYIDKNLDYDKTSEMILKCEVQLNDLQKQAGIFG